MTVQRVELLGSPRVVLQDGIVDLRPNLTNRALCFLAAADGPVGRDRLGFLFWPDAPDVTTRQRLRQLLKRIRRLEWLSRLEVADDHVAWPVPTDLDLLRDACARRQWEEIPPSGDLLPGYERQAPVEYEAWLLETRRTVRDRWRAAMVAAAVARAEAGDPGGGAGLLEPLLADDDQVLTSYMDLATRYGDVAGALAGYDRVADRLRRELGTEPPRAARELADRLRDAGGGTGVSGPEETGAAILVGRETEVREMLGVLARPACRLLTLLGPGGIGKSTLARMLQERLDPSYPDGSALVSLDEVADPSLVPAAIAAHVGVRLDGRLPAVQQLVDALHDQRVLLVLDNVEHLRGAWELLGSLVRACPGVDLVVTSRERLQLDEEWVFRVSGLRIEEAVELLLARAQRVVSEVSVPADDASRLCGAVGGSPLGIELAVSMLQVMDCAEVADEIERDLDVLSGGSAGARARHRSLEQAMAHSWAFASVAEREAVEALSVFAAPYSRELAAAVADVRPTLLLRLLDTSLVQRRPDGRYASHPLVRQYARSRLATDDDRCFTVRRRHATAVLDLLQPPERARRHRELLEDALAAWQFVAETVDTAAMARSAEGMVSLCEAVGRQRSGLELLSRAARILEGTASTEITALAQVRYSEAGLLYGLDRHAESADAAEAALQHARNDGDRRLMVRALCSLAWARKWTDGDTAQFRITSEALPIAKELGDDALTVLVLNGLGCSAPTLEGCREHLLAALAHTENGGSRERARLLTNLGMVCWGLGEAVTANEHLEQALALARAENRTDLIGRILTNLAFVVAQSSDLSTAEAWADQAEAASGRGESIDVQIYRTVVIGEIRRQAGELDEAARRLRDGLVKAHALRNEPFVLRALRLHAQILLDAGSVDQGLGVLAFILARTGVKGGDFTSKTINPRVWQEATASANPERVARAEGWARDQTLSGIVATVLEAR